MCILKVTLLYKKTYYNRNVVKFRMLEQLKTISYTYADGLTVKTAFQRTEIERETTCLCVTYIQI